MKGIRIELIYLRGRPMVETEVICECGSGVTTDKAIFVGVGSGPDKVIVCDCGRKYRVRPGATHIHISDE